MFLKAKQLLKLFIGFVWELKAIKSGNADALLI